MYAIRSYYDLEKGEYEEPLLYHPIHRKGAALLVQVIRFGDHRKMVISRDVSQLEKLETMRRDFVITSYSIHYTKLYEYDRSVYRRGGGHPVPAQRDTQCV